MHEKTKILLVDDEPLVREELGALLSDDGYEVITGADGEEGLELFRQDHPDMVITDVRMPRRDGLSLAMTIRQEAPGVPVAVITGHGSETMAIEALRAGATDFIKKPVRLENLEAALQRMESARRPFLTTLEELPTSVDLISSSWTFSLGNSLDAVPPFVEVLLRRITMGLDRTAQGELRLALREVILNAIEHGNLGLTLAEKSRALETGALEKLLQRRRESPELAARRVTVQACREGSQLSFQITDEGAGFDWRSLPDPTDVANLLAANGRGVLLARLSVDSLTYNEHGNQVTLVKRC